MELKYKNLNFTVNINTDNLDSDPEQGSCILYIKVKDVAELYKRIVGNTIGQSWESHEHLEMGDYTDDLVYGIIDDILDDYYGEDDETPIASYIDAKIKENDGDMALYNTDLIIVLLHHILKHSNGHHKKYELTYEGHPFWLLHDIKHAENDVSGVNIYVDTFSEESRLNEGFDWLFELNFQYLFTHEMFDKITEEFNSRFKRYPSLPKIKEHINSLLNDYE